MPASRLGFFALVAVGIYALIPLLTRAARAEYSHTVRPPVGRWGLYPPIALPLTAGEGTVVLPPLMSKLAGNSAISTTDLPASAVPKPFLGFAPGLYQANQNWWYDA